jgi:hypothetical protein
MVFIPHNATDEEILTIVRQWIDVFASEDYAKIFAKLGYSMSPYFNCSGDEAIRQEIKNYRSPELYPGVTDFKVTDWRLAQGGNLIPKQNIVRFKRNNIKLAGAIQFDLPMNGKWSDLQADFVLFDDGEFRNDSILILEEIQSLAQRQRETIFEE